MFLLTWKRKTTMRIIGDVHQKISEYAKLIQGQDESICVGDFGFADEHRWHMQNVSLNHKINFGNHDDTNFLHELHSCGNYSVVHDGEIFTIRGAQSTDKVLRYSGINYWDDEELSYSAAEKMLDLYEITQPRIVISHDCPEIVRQKMFGIYDPTFTSRLLNTTLEIWQPKIWIFGHHHQSKNLFVGKTRFICLAELETFDL